MVAEIIAIIAYIFYYIYFFHLPQEYEKNEELYIKGQFTYWENVQKNLKNKKIEVYQTLVVGEVVSESIKENEIVKELNQ